MRPLSFLRPLSRGRSARAPRGVRRSVRPDRRGATVVEFAVVAPLLFLLIFAALEFGRVVMVQQIITNAAREGARRGILEQTTVSEVKTTVIDYLADCSITGATVSVSPDDLGKAGFGDPVTVTVTVSYDQISWLPSPQFTDGVDLSVESVMAAERPE